MHSSTYTLETLSPVHIGSGRELLANSEFIYFDKERTLAVIDPAKVLHILGLDIMHHWLDSIRNHTPLHDLLIKRKPDLKAADVALRTIPLALGNVGLKQNLREQVSTLNRPYIPGSSIKGSLRTAILNQLMAQSPVRDLERFLVKDGRVLPSGQLTGHYLGEDANHDSFRFVKVGDAHFEPNDTAVGVVCLGNYHRGEMVKKPGADQMLELLPKGLSTSFHLRIQPLVSKHFDYLKVDVRFLESFATLAAKVNAHTKLMINNELEDLDYDFSIGNGDFSDVAETLQQMKRATEAAEKTGAMVLRLGFGMGWTFSTGAWVKGDEVGVETYDKIKAASRPNRKGTPYLDIPFPKTRKVLANNNLLGFVKITPP